MRLEFQATPGEVMRAVEALREFGRQRGLGEQELFGLSLALEECGSNIVHHALRDDGRQTFAVTFELTGDVFVIELRDRGPAFDPAAAPERPAGPDDADRPPGGWGIGLVRRYTDEMRYAREAGENVLRLTRRLAAGDRRKGLP